MRKIIFLATLFCAPAFAGFEQCPDLRGTYSCTGTAPEYNGRTLIVTHETYDETKTRIRFQIVSPNGQSIFQGYSPEETPAIDNIGEMASNYAHSCADGKLLVSHNSTVPNNGVIMTYDGKQDYSLDAQSNFVANIWQQISMNGSPVGGQSISAYCTRVNDAER